MKYCLLFYRGMMEHFLSPLDLFNISIRERAHGKCLEEAEAKLERQLDESSIFYVKVDQSIKFVTPS